MVTHRPLPSRNSRPLPSPRNSPTSQTAPSSKGLAPKDVVKGSADKVGQQYVYSIKIKLDEYTDAGWCTLLHWKLFSEDHLAKMVAEACAICNKVRIPERRKAFNQSLIMGVQQKKERPAEWKPLPPTAVLNFRSFQEDVSFIEAVLCDKFEFTKLIVTYSEGNIGWLIAPKTRFPDQESE